MSKIAKSIGIAAAISACALTVSAAKANVFSLLGWETTSTIASNATQASLALVLPTQPNVHAIASGLNFDSRLDPVNGYTLGGWLATGPVTGIPVYHNGGAPQDSMNNTIWEITGTMNVYTGEKFKIEHDDGLTFQLGSQTLVSAPGPTAPTFSYATYTGPTGPQGMTLIYGECCGAPAVLSVGSIPEPATWAMLGVGFAGLAFAGFHRARQQVSIVV